MGITKKHYNNIKKYIDAKKQSELPDNWLTIADNYIKSFDELEDIGVSQELQREMLNAIEDNKSYSEFKRVI